MKKIKKIAASIMAVAAMATSMVGILADEPTGVLDSKPHKRSWMCSNH